ncbi:MAG TPA: hypothetical protein VFE62_05980, partial [Gemmataceae bacterium]|nr:hypothetical protein [Gemmataceae bacterium]
PHITRRKLHGGVLLGLVGQLEDSVSKSLPKYAAFFTRLSTTFGYISPYGNFGQNQGHSIFRAPGVAQCVVEITPKTDRHSLI